MATVAEYIKAFGREDLLLVINPKYDSVISEIKELEADIDDFHNGSEKKVFYEVMTNHNIPMEMWAVYKTFRHWLSGTLAKENRLKEVKKEYLNLLPVWRELNNIKPSSHEEAFKIKVEQAKRYPIEQMYGGKMRETSQRIAGKCPFHEDDSPSFFIFKNDNHFHCFGCQANGDAIEFYMKLHQCDFKTAVNSLN